jgi:predicted ribosome quality control (RQC) complex YloA/Tae2 family protein
VFEPAAAGERALVVRLSADDACARLHVQHARTSRHDGPLGPFFRACEQELAGAECARVSQLRGDRIALLEFRRTRAGRARTLVLELLGRRATLALLDENEQILAALDPPRGHKAVRVQVGLRYQPPPAPREPTADGASLLESLATEARVPASDAPLSQRVELVLGAAQIAARAAELRDALRDRLAKKRAKTEQFLKGLEVRRTACAGAERVREDGEILKANLERVPRGATRVELPDWFSGDASATRAIELDAKLSPHANAERIFQRYHKLLRTAEELGTDVARGARTLGLLDALLARVDAEDPAALEREALAAGALEAPQQAPKRAPPPAARLPYKIHRAASGAEIWVGRSAEDNDELSLKHARGNDVWLHTADSPGSHIVLRVEKGAEPAPEDVLDAAHLAVHFSPLRGARKAAVHVARAKEVHKPRGAKPGLVHLSGGKTLHLRVDEERLRRLLDTRGREEAD